MASTQNMNRLDSMIARLQTQRACLSAAVTLIGGAPGVVLEIGLGKGRSYDFLRETLPEREIFAFDREVHAPPDAVPDAAHMFLGEFAETLPAAARQLGQTAVLAHADFGTEEAEKDRPTAVLLADLLPPLLRANAVVLSDRDLPMAAGRSLSLPAGAAAPYFMYRISVADS